MADGGVERAGKLDRRYDALTGGRDGRRSYYLITRRLKLTPSQFDAEPWWSQKLLWDGLVEELDEEQKASKRSGKRGGSGGGGSRVNAAGDLSNSPFKVQRAD